MCFWLFPWTGVFIWGDLMHFVIPKLCRINRQTYFSLFLKLFFESFQKPTVYMEKSQKAPTTMVKSFRKSVLLIVPVDWCVYMGRSDAFCKPQTMQNQSPDLLFPVFDMIFWLFPKTHSLHGKISEGPHNHGKKLLKKCAFDCSRGLVCLYGAIRCIL